MKKILLLAGALLCYVLTLSAQQEINRVVLTITTDKGKPLTSALVSLKSSPLYRNIDDEGKTSFRPMPSDTLYVSVGNYKTSIPTDGMDQLYLSFAKNSFYNTDNRDTRYPTVKIPSFNSNKIYTNPNIESYGTVSNLIKIQYPSITIKLVQGYHYLFLTSAPTSTGNKGAAYTNTSAGQGTLSIAPDPGTLGAATISLDGQALKTMEEVDKMVTLSRLVSITYEAPDLLKGRGGSGKVTIETLDHR